MLLPSSFDCAPLIPTSRTSHIPTLTMLSPPASSCHTSTSPTSAQIHRTCRSLQSLITTNLPSTTSSLLSPLRAQPRLASPITLTKTSTSLHSRKSARTHTPPARCTPITKPQTPKDEPSRKRRRLSHNHSTPGQDQENITHTTPKRQRLYPPSLPLGLERADFAALQDQAANIPLPSTPQNRHSKSLDAQREEEKEEIWNSSDDSALVSMILHKLRLRQSDWDDCARRLGKGKDSIGERWKMLVGDGEVGLRRGKGGRMRGNVVKMEFGGPLRAV